MVLSAAATLTPRERPHINNLRIPPVTQLHQPQLPLIRVQLRSLNVKPQILRPLQLLTSFPKRFGIIYKLKINLHRQVQLYIWPGPCSNSSDNQNIFIADCRLI